jgi:cation:H+ antiporter
MTALLIFIAAGAAIILASTRIVHYADMIAKRTRLGQLAVGATLLALVTSLPELATDISAVRIDAPNLAAGDLFGSSMANMLIFAILSIWFARWWRNYRFNTVEWITCSIALLVTAEAMLFILFDMGLLVLNVGLGSILISITYLIGARALFRKSVTRNRESLNQKEASQTLGDDTREPTELIIYSQSLLRIFTIFFAWAGMVLVAAPFLANAAEELAEITNLGDTFFGIISLAMLTSLPELASSIAAFRKRLPSMVLGNLMGSNGLNMLIILALDISMPKKSFLQAIADVHALAASDAIIMMLLAIGGIFLIARLNQSIGKILLGATVLFYSLSMYFIYIFTT